MKKQILITAIPHHKQRYETVGDWIPHAKALYIRVSQMKDSRYTFLVALHELIESELCSAHGIREREVSTFDRTFEWERSLGLHPKSAEPGNDPRCPYRKEHQYATKIERMTARKIGANWKQYKKTVETLGEVV